MSEWVEDLLHVTPDDSNDPLDHIGLYDLGGHAKHPFGCSRSEIIPVKLSNNLTRGVYVPNIWRP